MSEQHPDRFWLNFHRIIKIVVVIGIILFLAYAAHMSGQGVISP